MDNLYELFFSIDKIEMRSTEKLLSILKTANMLVKPAVDNLKLSPFDLYNLRSLTSVISIVTVQLKKYLESANDLGKSPENCAANLMPLTAKSNEAWLDKEPCAVLEEVGITYKKNKDLLHENFIDEECFAFLTEDYPKNNAHVEKFWQSRANLIADDLLDQTRVQAPE